MVLAVAETRMGLADAVDVIDVVLTASIGVVGLVALHSYGRQQRLKIADQRWVRAGRCGTSRPTPGAARRSRPLRPRSSDGNC